MYECIDILTEFRTGGGALFVIQCFCKKKKKREIMNNNTDKMMMIIIRILLIRTVKNALRMNELLDS